MTDPSEKAEPRLEHGQRRAEQPQGDLTGGCTSEADGAIEEAEAQLREVVEKAKEKLQESTASDRG